MDHVTVTAVAGADAQDASERIKLPAPIVTSKLARVPSTMESP